MPRHGLTILCLLLASTAPALPESVRAASRARAAAEAQDEVVRYQVKAGDRLEALAAAHFVDPEDWRKAAALNALPAGAPLVPGSVLLVRQSWLKAAPIKAEIAAFRGAVIVHSADHKMAASVGLKLDEGDTLETGANGFVSLRLPDASLIALPSNSRIRLTRLRAVSLTQSIDRRFTLEAGRSEARVTPLQTPASKFIITTPVAVAAVRGTDYRVSFTPADMTARVEVIEGKVAVAAAGAPGGTKGDVLLLPRFGTVATPAGVRPAIALLAAPALDQPARLQSGKTVSFKLKPLAGAKVFLVELATDAGFVDRIASLESAGTEVRFENVPNGSLHVRVAARDANGLTGMPASFAFERRLAASLIKPESAGPDGGSPVGNETAAKPASKARSAAAAVLPDASRWAGIPLESSRTLNDDKQEADADAEEAGNSGEAEEGDAAFDGEIPAASGPLGVSRFGSESGGGSGGGGSGGLSVPARGAQPGGVPGSLQSPGSALPPLLVQPGPFQPVDIPPFIAPPATDIAPQLLPPSGPVARPTAPVVAPAPVPEPFTWTMLVGGFGLVGLALRRRKARKA